jgi:hypothetical protein
MMPGSTIQMPNIDTDIGPTIGNMLAAPGMIVMIEGGLLYLFVIAPRCATSAFATVCLVYNSAWDVVWNYFDMHYPLVMGFCSILTICIAYVFICAISWIINWSLFALSSYLFYCLWFPRELLRNGPFLQDSSNEIAFIVIVFLTFTAILILFMGHAMLDTARWERREANGSGNVTLIERITTIWR